MRRSQSISGVTEKPNIDLGKVRRCSSIEPSTGSSSSSSVLSRVTANVHTGHTAESDLDATKSIDLSQYREPKTADLGKVHR